MIQLDFQERSIIRAFFAIDLPDEIKNTLAHLQANIKYPVRWTEPRHLHITLQFMKELKLTDLDRLVESIKTALQATMSFSLELGSVELFPNVKHPRFISLAIEPQEKLANLAKLIGEQILAAHYPIDRRPFRAHLTLGRIQDSLKNPAFENNLQPAMKKCCVTQVVLFQSILAENGANYLPLARLNLPKVGSCA